MPITCFVRACGAKQQQGGSAIKRVIQQGTVMWLLPLSVTAGIIPTLHLSNRQAATLNNHRTLN